MDYRRYLIVWDFDWADWRKFCADKMDGPARSGQRFAERVKHEVAQYGAVESIDAASCELAIPTETVDWVAFCLAATEPPFVIYGPAKAIEYVRDRGERLIAATKKGLANAEV